METMTSEERTQSELIHREMERKSNDIFLIHNPTDKDFRVVFNGYIWVIPHKNKDMGFGKGNREVPRYIAERYIKKMSDHMLMQKSDEAIKQENERRIEKGHAVMNKWEEQGVFETPLRVDMVKERAQIFPIICLGIVREFGNDQVEMEQQEETIADLVNPEASFMDSLGKAPVSNTRDEEEVPTYKKTRQRQDKVISEIAA